MTLEKALTDTVSTTLKLADSALKKVWSLMDAAAEKKPPSEQLSRAAVQAIQGVPPPENQ
ncbi:MAG: hypothetical protein FJ030_18150 [Chloroflexi bacterium]|nr:hypothetical protein [Chloroflexota bacterium]